jgi:hypothetical protein
MGLWVIRPMHAIIMRFPQSLYYRAHRHRRLLRARRERPRSRRTAECG